MSVVGEIKFDKRIAGRVKNTIQGCIFIFLLAILCIPAAEARGLYDLQLVTENWHPFNYEADGEPAGISTDIVKAALKEADISYTIQVLPWARAYDMAQVQENIGIYTIFKLPSRIDLFKWVKIEGFSSRMYLFSPSFRSDIDIKTLEDAKKYRIGVTRASSTHHFLLSKGFIEDENLFPVSSEIQNAFKADPKIRRLDLTTGDTHSLANWLKTYNYPPDYWKKELFLFEEEFYIAFSKKTDDRILDKVRGGLIRITENGELERILKRHEKELSDR